MTSMPPGWYDDGRGALRWWDGTQWTEHVATPDPEPVPGAPAAESIDEIIPPELQEAPAGYPGADAAGAFIGATEPAKSKLWILWVVLGVVLLGIVIAAAVIIPLLFLSLSKGADGADGVEPDGAAQTAAVAAVEQYDVAWREVDCDAFMESTTQNFRNDQQLTECSTFEEQAQAWSESVEDYTIVVNSVEEEDGGIEVETTESYLSYIDEEGELVDEPVPYEEEWVYHIVEEDGRWAIDTTD